MRPQQLHICECLPHRCEDECPACAEYLFEIEMLRREVAKYRHPSYLDD